MNYTLAILSNFYSNSFEKSAIIIEEDKHRVPLFNGSNYNNWKFKMEVLLEEIGLKAHIDSWVLDDKIRQGETTEAYGQRMANLRKKDTKCKSQIIQRIADSQSTLKINQQRLRYG